MYYFLAESNNFQSKNLAINSLYLQKRIDFKLMNTKADSKKLLSSYIYIYIYRLSQFDLLEFITLFRGVYYFPSH